MKISFDFDSTLTREDIQEIANDFISRGHDVHITTSRSLKSSYRLVGGAEIKFQNNDLFKVAEDIGIPVENIHFTEMQDKVSFLNTFDMHFDDDEYEIDLITRYNIKCLGVLINYKNYGTNR